ncbi:hypothetical protein DIPPA_04205 [Diplonema papillatum]|nr:hypothetical protein DIPPA_04205 [Diplonema papillatum]
MRRDVLARCLALRPPGLVAAAGRRLCSSRVPAAGEGAPAAEEEMDPFVETAREYRFQGSTDPFAPPGVVTGMKTYVLPKQTMQDAANPETARRADPDDPQHWSTGQVTAWIVKHYNDASTPLDPDLLDAFAMGGLTGKDLLGAYPNSLFKEIRRTYAQPDHVPQVTEVLLRETVLLCFKYGSQDSFW